MTQNMLDFGLLLFLDSRLTFHVMDQKIGRVLEYSFVFVRQHQMRSSDGLQAGFVILLVALIK